VNEFVEQFLVESRELIEQATDDLLTLEGRPQDQERIDGAFRAFHTLKGAAGIIEFEAMGRALHAAEDVLAKVRAGETPVMPQLIGDCLTCLDQVVQWLDAIQANDGDLPAHADADADALLRRFGVGAQAPSSPPPVSNNWGSALAQRHPQTAGVTAIRYRPAADCFFQGDDPLARLAAVPDLQALEIHGLEAGADLDAFDPFTCALWFEALAGCSTDAAQAALADALGEVELANLADRPSTAADTLLEAQRLLLRQRDPEGLAGRIGSAGLVSANVLRRLGRGEDADRLATLARESAATGDAEQLSTVIQLVLTDAFVAASPDADLRPPAEAAARTLRVDVERIDALVNLTGELLVAKNALGHAATLAQEGASAADLAEVLKGQHATLQRLVAELQRSVLNIRVLPLRYVFQRFPRLVREMVVSLGKPARLVTEGDETEADKVIVESLFEPLLHVLRNALDHGVESPEVRAAAGKSASATITLRAAHLADRVVIEVEDDGGGIDVERVRQVAAERGVASAEALAAMADQEVVDLIFAPGFSTAAEVTSLSGRGVGMDAVRTAIERLGGRVQVESRAGAGTVIRFSLPFAVMISRVLTVQAGGEWFGVPMDAVIETVRVPRAEISPVGASRAFVLRNRTIPVIDLAAALGEPAAQTSSADANVVVALSGGQVAGLEVDRLGERLDVMLKPMEGLLSGLPGVAGTSLLGDGRVLIILDLPDLLR
jgi:two-component system, chemotaxis family, sensor kinase CheA